MRRRGNLFATVKNETDTRCFPAPSSIQRAHLAHTLFSLLFSHSTIVRAQESERERKKGNIENENVREIEFMIGGERERDKARESKNKGGIYVHKK